MNHNEISKEFITYFTKQGRDVYEKSLRPGRGNFMKTVSSKHIPGAPRDVWDSPILYKKDVAIRQEISE